MTVVRASLLCLMTAICFSCGGPTLSPKPPVDARPTLMLAVDTPFAILQLPEHNRPHLPTPPDDVPLPHWTKTGNTYVTALPFRLRSFFSFRPPAGMVLRDGEGHEIPHQYLTLDRSKPHWTFNPTEVELHNISDNPVGYTISYPRATDREASLNRQASGKSNAAFVRTKVVNGHETRTGLLLPAPAHVAWDITIPKDAALHFTPWLVRPEIADAPPSDGATIKVTWEEDGHTTVLWEHTVTGPESEEIDIDLTSRAGHSGRLHIHTGIRENSTFDYVFLAEPTLAPHKDYPRRVVIVFIDTLRPDHLTAYGYPRETSPGIAKLARRGVRFDNAHSVAPWTLPSTRTMVTGRLPGAYYQAESLPTILAREGFDSVLFAANMYLGASFDIDRGWGQHHVALLEDANVQVKVALEWLEEHKHRDSLMLLHLMDAHLPYNEPKSYRDMFLSVPKPDRLPSGDFGRGHVIRAGINTPAERQYIRDRYDNNIRYIDDFLQQLWAQLSPRDIVVLLSDHGEEFWEHGGYEHGHSLYEELLHIPLIIAGGGAPVGEVVTAPVSLLDVTPTILDMLNIDIPKVDGTSLVPVMRNKTTAKLQLQARPLAFGHPLYGWERWGVLAEGLKYTTTAGQQELFFLPDDPGERQDLIVKQAEKVAPMRDKMASAFGRDVHLALRLNNTYDRRPAHDLTVAIDVPGGISDAWVGAEPTHHSSASVQISKDRHRVVATWDAKWRGKREVWVLPNRPIADITRGLNVTACANLETQRFGPIGAAPIDLRTHPEILSGRVDGRGFALSLGVTPVPTVSGTTLSGFDSEVQSSLVAMGYAIDDAPTIDETITTKPSVSSACAPEAVYHTP